MDSGIERGYGWIVEFVANHWLRLNARVLEAVKEEAEVQRNRLQMLRTKYGSLDDDVHNGQLIDKEEQLKEDPFRPINEVVEEITKRNEQSKVSAAESKKSAVEIKSNDSNPTNPTESTVASETKMKNDTETEQVS
jgi:hypothetical protein